MDHDKVKNLVNHAQDSFRKGKYETAESKYVEALDILSRMHDKKNGYYGSIIDQLGIVYLKTGQYEKAEQRLNEAYGIFESYGNKEDIAGTLDHLTILYITTRQYREAEDKAKESLKLKEDEIFGKIHHSNVVTRSHLVTIYLETKRLRDALLQMKKINEIDDLSLKQMLQMGTEEESMKYLYYLQQRFFVFISIVLNYFSENVVDLADAAELILRRKAVILEALALRKRKIYNNDDKDLEKLKELDRKINEIKTEISYKELSGKSLWDDDKSLLRLYARKELLESRSAHGIGQIDNLSTLDKVSIKDVMQAIPAETLLIEFLEFDKIDVELKIGQRCYLALILYSGNPPGFLIQDLGNANTIDDAILEFNKFNTFYHAIEEIRNHGIKLKKKLLDPLLEQIRNKSSNSSSILLYKNIMISPDGQISRVPFEVLPTDDNGWMIDEYQFNYVSSSRDTLRFDDVALQSYSSSCIVADPDFDLVMKSPDKEEPTSLIARARQSTDLDRSKIHFVRLPDTRNEAELIGDILDVKPWIDDQVLETRIKNCKSPSILHIATHGFFLPNQSDEMVNIREVSSTTLNSTIDGALNVRAWSKLKNPLLRSGLALAGANTRIKGGMLPKEAEDGILTAEDVASMDLTNTHMVVLSACDTGLGDVYRHNSEGVFGLRRSFVLAGAQTLVMTLWKVPDKQTQELMVEFYRGLKKEIGRAEALREAQLEMKRKYPHPVYWGAFICQGNPGRLSIPN